MKLNVITILNEIEVENKSEKLINDFYNSISSLNDFIEEYDEYKYLTEMYNRQTMDMIHYYESRHGLDYVNEYMNCNFEEVMTFDEWLEDIKSKVTFVY